MQNVGVQTPILLKNFRLKKKVRNCVPCALGFTGPVTKSTDINAFGMSFSTLKILIFSHVDVKEFKITEIHKLRNIVMGSLKFKCKHLQ